MKDEKKKKKEPLPRGIKFTISAGGVIRTSAEALKRSSGLKEQIDAIKDYRDKRNSTSG